MRSASLFGVVLLAQACMAQIEGVFVERISGHDGVTTYRLFIDLEKDHILQTIYGDTEHTLTLSTTTTFHNDSVAGAPFGEQIKTGSLEAGLGWSDSFLAFGFGSDSHKAVPMHLDTDGSILQCSEPRSARCEKDGLVPAENVPSTVNLNVATGYVNGVKGSLIQTDNGGWGVLGGVKGSTTENLVLVAQLTTDGDLRYALNVQVRTPEGEIVRCTATPTENAEERHFPVLKSSVSQ